MSLTKLTSKVKFLKFTESIRNKKNIYDFFEYHSIETIAILLRIDLAIKFQGMIIFNTLQILKTFFCYQPLHSIKIFIILSQSILQNLQNYHTLHFLFSLKIPRQLIDKNIYQPIKKSPKYHQKTN